MEVLEVARSTFYYEPQVKPEDAVLLEAIERILMRWPFYGYRRVTVQLKREGRAVGETRVRLALARHGAPDIHHSDQGSQYATPDYTDLLPETTRISMAAVGQPTENGLAERFIRTLKEEHLDYSDHRDFDDALEQLTHWLEIEYMTERIHSAQGYLTPASAINRAFNSSLVGGIVLSGCLFPASLLALPQTTNAPQT